MKPTNKNNNLTTKIITPLSTSWLDYPNDHSLALIVYFCGCEHNCKKCHNPELQNPYYEKGKNVTISELVDLIDNFSKKNDSVHLVLSGGDPLSSCNIDFTRELCKQLNDSYYICIYTGYEIDYVKLNNINAFDFIICGAYKDDLRQESKKTDDYVQFASLNQKLYKYNFDYELVSNDKGRYYFSQFEQLEDLDSLDDWEWSFEKN